MEIITHTIDELLPIPESFCVFDIETTGLSSKYNCVILIGLLYVKNNKTIIQQFFAHDPTFEKEILFYFKEVFKTFDKHITFNGISFDIPFLNNRFSYNDLDFFIDKKDNIDILKLIKPHQKKLNLADCKLKTVEKLLGINRKDTISGKESVNLYKEFVKTKNINLKEKILLHNYEDIYYLAKLFKIKDIISSKQDFIEVNIFDNKFKLKLDSFKVLRNILYIEYSLENKLPINLEIYKDCYSINGSENKLIISLNLKKGKDINSNTVLFFEGKDNIPIKVEKSFVYENIKSLGKAIINYESHNNFM
ncbi:hypothetical protein SAMN05661008_00455 [Alkalithermobacter thermoalcaliphilus JW-YL-7 = DSM 7308]|uniref:Exonuclease-like protein n=1 Tax=Alkalithermobacter thermoalcaliphilus JW-YL-7 = DSM 7308 TaxID=1121328 RepID=A0A150FNY1_CLOPD|nr:exonuclease-like protein [[Clostridium] paradoxum JW-YL-7 = DSM 7308]SHK54672.1 hypothetical protein SAMN05661008_00455 [[Clostridium] paradoxum JW-YL-7 = DSM 7308]